MLKTKKFQRAIEDFKCEHCGISVKGNGYTNHCPNCLWSKHVDENPGDRTASCAGLMEPIRVEAGKGEEKTLVHRCLGCGVVRRCKVSPKDNFDLILKIMRTSQIYQ